ncbi:hypothetical protein GSS87_03950 [Corynebacterium sp. 4HC-13]|uniref:hypothetical protein n=1 Tax=Corynebacterium anserum TaxID=2684406 RepID=UPI001639504A|nr:hypothetical protein [Corynebacterium anserum]MBC2681555.1 hypothetical protein [Corynebacterium anserum]
MSTGVNEARAAFVDNLHAMATGSYLRKEDREFWEAPYPETVVGEARVIVDSLVDAISRIPRLSEDEQKVLAASTDVLQEASENKTPSEPDQITRAVVAAVSPIIEDLLRLSDKYEGAVLEDEELEDLDALLRALCTECEANYSVVSEHVHIMIDSHS